MQDLHSRIGSLRRPRLLVQSARFALHQYRRDPVLRRLLGYRPGPGAGPVVADLLEIEAEMNTLRTETHPAYRAERHVMVLTALMAEGRSLRRAEPVAAPAGGPGDQAMASGIAALRRST